MLDRLSTVFLASVASLIIYSLTHFIVAVAFQDYALQECRYQGYDKAITQSFTFKYRCEDNDVPSS